MPNKNADIELQSIYFVNNKFHNDSLSWFYPYEMTFEFFITNQEDSMIEFAEQGKNNNSKYYELFIVDNKDSITLHVNKNVLIFDNKASVTAYCLESPVFDSIYNQDEFKDYLKDLKNHNYIIRYHNNSVVNETKINLSKNFKFYFLHWVDGALKARQIGYPNKKIPDTIKPIKPIHGIEYWAPDPSSIKKHDR